MSGLYRLLPYLVFSTRLSSVVASYNVQINLSRIKDKTFVASCEKEVDEVLKRLETLFADVDGSANIYLT